MTDASVFGESEKITPTPVTPLDPPASPVVDNTANDKLDAILKQQKDAQEFISTLKEENSVMRGEMKSLQEKLADAAQVEDLLEYQQQNSTPAVPEPKTPPVNRDELLADLKSEVLGELSATEAQSREAQNIAASEQLAKETFGEKYSDYVNEAASELKLPVSFVQNLAKTSPEAFMNVIKSATKTVSSAPTLSSINTGSLQPEDPMSYFNKVNLAATLPGIEGMDARKLKRSNEYKAKEREAILARAMTEGRLQ